MKSNIKHPATRHIEEIGINDAYGHWRAALGITCNPFGGHSLESPKVDGDRTLRNIVEHEHHCRREGNQHRLTCVWMIIDGDQNEVNQCAEWVRQECPIDDDMVFDFVTTDDENDEFLDGSLSLVIPATWSPSGVSDVLRALVSRFPQLSFWGSALEFRNGESEPGSGSKFVGIAGSFWSDTRQVDRPACEKEAA